MGMICPFFIVGMIVFSLMVIRFRQEKSLEENSSLQTAN